jgi:hypothetical protein
MVMVTLGIRIMANLPDRKDDQWSVEHVDQSGHFYLAEGGHAASHNSRDSLLLIKPHSIEQRMLSDPSI